MSYQICNLHLRILWCKSDQDILGLRSRLLDNRMFQLRSQPCRFHRCNFSDKPSGYRASLKYFFFEILKYLFIIQPSNSAGQSHLIDLWSADRTHFPPFSQGNGQPFGTIFSQLSPVKPSWHLQYDPVKVLWHVPPFLHLQGGFFMVNKNIDFFWNFSKHNFIWLDLTI